MSLNIFLPFVLLITMNSFIIHTLQRRFSQFKSEGQGQCESQGHNSNQNVKSKVSEKQIYIILLLISFSYLILWTPVYFHSMLAKLMDFSPKTPYAVAATFLFTETAEKLHYMNYGINFFLYEISGPKFKNNLLSLFKCTRHQSSETSQRRTISISLPQIMQ